MGTRIQLRSHVPIAKVEARYGSHPTSDDYDVILHGDCKVFAPDGTLLCALVRGGMDVNLVEAAYPALHWMRRLKSDNRGNYAGQSERVVKINSDGTVSRTTRSLAVRTAVIGFYDRYPRIPFCRQTAFTANQVDRWKTIVPLAQQVSQLFEDTVRARYKIQKDYVAGIHEDFRIANTVFTTMTVNNSIAAAVHQDAGDYKPGFGVLACVRRGQFQGAELVFPEYRVAVDLQDRDVLFFNPHQWHGNVQFRDAQGPECKPEDGGWERISMVFYVRAKMAGCGSAREEAEVAKRHAVGGSLV